MFKLQDTVEPTGLEIAIVGMAGRFPGADDVDGFWRNIRDGVESVSAFTDDQLRERGIPQRLLDDPDYVKAGVVFEGFDQFDAGFFGYTPREAENLDPQQRVFLECAWASLEHAGCDPARWPGKVGVYAGEGTNVYLIRNLLPSFGLGAHTGIADLLGLMSGNSGGSLCTRVAYKLDLRGPAVSVQTACSTSLTAVHTACQALLSHDCDMALAGGVWLNLLQEGGYRYQAGAILSRDGHCRAFDADADGTVIGSGAGVVVLKRLDEALRDGDTIHAVIKGTAANNDGAAKVGFTAPSIDGQAEVIRAAQLIAGVSADTIGYVETHGTGTTLGDPIEIAALTQAFRADTQRRGFCAVGSVKTNIGHLDAAAGVAGLIKAAMALKHHTLPPSLHFKRPHPQIDFEGSPFYVNAQCRPWPDGPTPRRAGVSAFGIGGTNVHVVLEEAPAQRYAAQGSAWQVMPLSARNTTALQMAAQQLADHLEAADADASLADVAHTLQTGRRAMLFRGTVVADGLVTAVQALRAPENAFDHATRVPDVAPEVAFLFPGGGTQHVNMGLALYRDHPVFREEIDRCCAALREVMGMGMDLRPLLYPATGDEAEADEQLGRIEYTQPLLFSVEYAMARLWMSRGVQPALMLGHSLGEYVAACLAGVFSLEDALRIVATRGRLMQSMSPGAMTAIALSESELAPFLATGCDIAAINGDQLCVLAGPMAAIEAAEQKLFARGLMPRRLRVSIASHSAMTESIVAELQQVIASVPRSAPRIPFISNVTGKPITAQQAIDPAYWGQHLRGTVRFADGVAELLRAKGRVLLEVGPGETLAGLARQHPLADSAAVILSSQVHPQKQAHNECQMASAMGQLWCAGVDIDWAACHPGRQARRVPLPTYPFQRQSYWTDMPEPGNEAPTSSMRKGGDAFHVPVWQRTAPANASSTPAPVEGCTLVFAEESGLTDALIRQLEADAPGHAVVRVVLGIGYAETGLRHFSVRPGERRDHEQLLRKVQSDSGPVTRVFHLWSVDEQPLLLSPLPSEQVMERGYFSLLALAQAIDSTSGGRARKLSIEVVANQMEDVSGLEPLCPEKAMLFSLCKVIAQEYPHIACRVTDVVLPVPGSVAEAWLARQLAAPRQAPHDETLVAYRGPHRWVKTYAPLPCGSAPQQRLRSRGVYLITGGLGGVGLAVARHLAESWQARLVLLGRTPLPERSQWEALLADEVQPQALRTKLAQLTELENLGGEVLVVAADVADAASMKAAAAQARARFGMVQGVVHAAGHANSGMIATRTRAAIDEVFAPKLQGTRFLLDALQGEPLDFVLLCSSISSMAGGLGMSDYAAANAYLDALASLWQRSATHPVIAVNWDAWRDLGMAAGRVLPEGIGMDGPAGARAVERIVNGPAFAQVVISTTDLNQRLGELDNGMLDLLETGLAAKKKCREHPRPALDTPFVAPEGELESVLAGIWQDMLGIAGVGIDDNLFELGGDSLLAIQILARARKAYEVELHPAAFFKAPTLRDLAFLIETQLIEEIEADVPADAEPDRSPATV
ncbi:type I polyketide synthase [Variovorax ginsengisoli]|uniref:Acyl transferase domain-containing protein/acyl carrier protein n=1 Tax=Variovorax ginsengisoli TaxID=363844 RepID=A0ABT9SEB8_9BURK|nr:type I polyketide synthase [Variovorax ginsengisoli]MDP9901727.1 acyl transferase domain-containing protein/acyl carrier protein [Variovorax ginsengisoli]